MSMPDASVIRYKHMFSLVWRRTVVYRMQWRLVSKVGKGAHTRKINVDKMVKMDFIQFNLNYYNLLCNNILILKIFYVCL